MPWSAFSRAPSRIFYTILLRRFCMLAGIVSEIGGGGDLGIQTVIFCLLESFYYQMHFVFILFAINHKLIAYWAISGFLFFHIKKLCLPIRNPCFLSLSYDNLLVLLSGCHSIAGVGITPFIISFLQYPHFIIQLSPST